MKTLLPLTVKLYGSHETTSGRPPVVAFVDKKSPKSVAMIQKKRIVMKLLHCTPKGYE